MWYFQASFVTVGFQHKFIKKDFHGISGRLASITDPAAPAGAHAHF
jgi:hypothetical protein